MGDLTILTWLWDQPGGRVTYTAETVNIWADMLRRNLKIPHRLACVTDIPEGISADIGIISPPRDFESARVPTWGPDKPQCLRRLAMFSPDAGAVFGQRFVSMDMDCVIAGNLDDLFTRKEDIVLYKSPAGVMANPRPYNGSMLMMTAGVRPQVYTGWTPEGSAEASARYIGSDQAWISAVLGFGEATWGPEDGINWWQSNGNRDNPRLMFFPGNPKPWNLCRQGDAWVQEHYRADSGGTCLFLGFGADLWADVRAAGEYDAVIATPEAAESWPGRVLDVAYDRHEAERLARMHGFSKLVSCGMDGIDA